MSTDRTATGGWWLACSAPVLLAVAWLWLLYLQQSDAARRYDSAPWCNTLPSATDHSDCRYGVSATVTELHISSGKGSSYWMTLHGAPPADGRITFDAEPSVLEIAGIGDTVHAEVWRGQVVRVQFEGYSDATPAAPAYPVHRVLAWLIAAAVVAASLPCFGAGQRFDAWERRWYRGSGPGGHRPHRARAGRAALLHRGTCPDATPHAAGHDRNRRPTRARPVTGTATVIAPVGA